VNTVITQSADCPAIIYRRLLAQAGAYVRSLADDVMSKLVKLIRSHNIYSAVSHLAHTKPLQKQGKRR